MGSFQLPGLSICWAELQCFSQCQGSDDFSSAFSLLSSAFSLLSSAFSLLSSAFSLLTFTSAVLSRVAVSHQSREGSEAQVAVMADKMP